MFWVSLQYPYLWPNSKLTLRINHILIGGDGLYEIRNFPAPDGENANLSRIRKRWHLWTDSFERAWRTGEEDSSFKKARKIHVPPGCFFQSSGILLF